MQNLRKGFTLLELIVVIVIVGILSAVAIPTFINTVNKSRIASARSTLESVFTSAKAIAAFKASDPSVTGNPLVTDTELTQALAEAGLSGSANVVDTPATATTPGTITYTVGGKTVTLQYDAATDTSATLAWNDATNTLTASN